MILLLLSQPTFKICLHNTTTDSYVSGTLKEGRAWEPEISNFVKVGLENYDAVAAKSAVFLDVGANIGTHTLYALATGHRVYAVEPLTINDIRVNMYAVLSLTEFFRVIKVHLILGV